MAVNSIDLYLGQSRKVLKALGMWHFPEKYLFLHKIYTTFILLTQYTFILFEFVYIADVWGDIDAMTEASYLLFTQASVCYKTTVLIMNKENLAVLMEYMQMEILIPRGEHQEGILVKLSTKVRRLCVLFLTSALTTCTLWAFVPLLDTSGDRVFPFRIWMPFVTEKSLQYGIGYAYQMGSIYISAFLFFAVDSVTLSMIMFGCSQLEIIADKLKGMQIAPMSSTLSDKCRIANILENNNLLIECITQHQTIKRFMNIVENTYHANIFFQLSGTVAIICIIGLRITMAEPSSVQFFSMINYMVTMLSQLLLYCWCGNELTMRSEELRQWLYQSPWYDQDIKFQKLLLITMECMKKPIVFKAAHYIPLSRPLFISILRSSYSFFAVLNQTNK